MSGPKGYGYSVVSAAELARREAESARAALDATIALLREARFRAAAVGVRDMAPFTESRLRADATAAEIRGVTETVKRAVADLEVAMRERRTEMARKELARIIATLDTSRLGSTGPARRADRPANTARPARTHPRTTARDETRVRLDKALTAASVLQGAEFDRIKALAVSVSAALEGSQDSSPPTSLAIGRLETAVIEAVNAQRQQESAERLRAQIATANADLTGLAAETVRTQLGAAITIEEFSRVKRDFARQREQTRAEADRSFVLATSRAVLAEMGYEVSETRSGGIAPTLTVTDTHWPRHRLRIVLDPAAATMHTSPLAIAPTDRRDDVRFEEAACAALAELTARLKERGVATTLDRHRAPGEVPMTREYDDSGTPGPAVARERTFGDPHA